jgi:2-haloacid dehalogenase
MWLNCGAQNNYSTAGCAAWQEGMPISGIEDVQAYKPHPAVYQLAKDRLVLDADEICFISSNGWDAYSAKAFGFYVVWCNRFGQVAERIPTTPDAEIKTLSELPGLVGLR